jgi:hypothetical protein
MKLKALCFLSALLGQLVGAVNRHLLIYEVFKSSIDINARNSVNGPGIFSGINLL